MFLTEFRTQKYTGGIISRVGIFLTVTPGRMIVAVHTEVGSGGVGVMGCVGTTPNASFRHVFPKSGCVYGKSMIGHCSRMHDYIKCLQEL